MCRGDDAEELDDAPEEIDSRCSARTEAYVYQYLVSC